MDSTLLHHSLRHLARSQQLQSLQVSVARQPGPNISSSFVFLSAAVGRQSQQDEDHVMILIEVSPDLPKEVLSPNVVAGAA